MGEGEGRGKMERGGRGERGEEGETEKEKPFQDLPSAQISEVAGVSVGNEEGGKILAKVVDPGEGEGSREEAERCEGNRRRRRGRGR
jgi:hypothetical protein